MTIEILPIFIDKEIEKNDNLIDLILATGNKFKNEDVIVFSQKIISKQEGRIVNLSSVIPSVLSTGISAEYEKDPKLLEVILSECKRIVRMKNGIIITETKNGIVCANSGVDESNVIKGNVTLLPVNSDHSAKKLQNEIFEKTGKKTAVLVSDTFGRPFRMGQTNHVVGVAGISSIINYEGTLDSFGRILRVTAIAIVDELSSAAELVMGKTLNCPVAIIRNYKYQSTKGTVKDLIRPDNEDLFK